MKVERPQTGMVQQKSSDGAAATSSVGLKQSLRGLDYAQQLQMLEPRDAGTTEEGNAKAATTRADAPAETVKADTTGPEAAAATHNGPGRKLDLSTLTRAIKVDGMTQFTGDGFGRCLPKIDVNAAGLSEKQPAERLTNDGRWAVGPVHVGIAIQPQVNSGKRQKDVVTAAPPTITLSPVEGKTRADGTPMLAWEQAYNDLLPVDEGGLKRSPREQYYSKALVERHELVHARDFEGAAPGAVDAAVAEWSGKSFEDEKSAMAGVAALKRRINQHLMANYAGPAALSDEDGGASKVAYPARPGEQRAYADGVPHYNTLAVAVKEAGTAMERTLAERKKAKGDAPAPTPTPAPTPRTGGTPRDE